MMYGYGGDYGMGYGFFHLMGFLFWVVVIIVAISLFRRNRGGHGGRHWSAPWPDASISLLKERYAKGEISKEEYEERKKVLMG